jgi:hypothetical protein
MGKSGSARSTGLRLAPEVGGSPGDYALTLWDLSYSRSTGSQLNWVRKPPAGVNYGRTEGWGQMEILTGMVAEVFWLAVM